MDELYCQDLRVVKAVNTTCGIAITIFTDRRRSNCLSSTTCRHNKRRRLSKHKLANLTPYNSGREW